MNASQFLRPMRVIGAVGLLVAATIAPSLPAHADGGGHVAAKNRAPSGADTLSTVESSLDASGRVKSAVLVSHDGSVRAFTQQTPLSLSVNSQTGGSTRSTTYQVHNTSGAPQTVRWSDPPAPGSQSGSPVARSAQADVQLPLVGQLTVQLPADAGTITAPGASIATAQDGSRTIVWSLVLFTPLGSPTQSVSFTETGQGAPIATLRAAYVDPTSTPGLSAAAQDANAQIQLTSGYGAESGGADSGLTQLRTGVGKLVSGLQQLAAGAHKLHDGLGGAQSGEVALNKGAKKAHSGAQQLTTGLGKVNAGSQQLSTGLAKIHGGQQMLTTGLSQLYTGQQSLTTGLGKIHAGLGQLADKKKGLPSASAGAGALQSGVGQLLAGVGSDTAPNTLIYGVDQISAGIGDLLAGFTDPSKGIDGAVGCTYLAIEAIVHGTGPTTTPSQDACKIPSNVPAHSADPYISGLLGDNAYGGALGQVYQGLTSQVVPGLSQLQAGLVQIQSGLDKPHGTPGVRQGLQQINAGLSRLHTGLQSAVAGVSTLYTGTGQALAGSQQLASGNGQTLTGSQKLTDGSAAALTGSQQLAVGTGKTYTGSQQLTTGLSKISDGLGKEVAGLPAAITGAAQIAVGLDQTHKGATQVHTGVGQVQDTAVHPLSQQIAGNADAAGQKIAVLTAAGDNARTAPGGANRTFVLTQNPAALKLAANNQPTAHGTQLDATGISAGIGIGIVVLVLGLLLGWLVGRRRRMTTEIRTNAI